jgi:hypothetical protein
MLRKSFIICGSAVTCAKMDCGGTGMFWITNAASATSALNHNKPASRQAPELRYIILCSSQFSKLLLNFRSSFRCTDGCNLGCFMENRRRARQGKTGKISADSFSHQLRIVQPRRSVPGDPVAFRKPTIGLLWLSNLRPSSYPNRREQEQEQDKE